MAAVLGLVSLAARPARAAEGLYLNWTDCALGPTATSDRAFACNSNFGQEELFCAFTMPAPTNNVVSVEIVVDMQNATSPLPDWWRFDTGGCRPNDLSVAADFSGMTSCSDMWGGAPRTAMVQGYTPGEPRLGTNQARIKVTAWVLPQDAVTLDGTTMYYAVRVIVKNDLTTGSPSCVGCGSAACLVLNSIQIGRVSGGDIFLQVPGAGDANWARWQGGLGADCAAVPVRARAWGQLKSLYR
ncbi:MAG: hypothetical protein HYR74_03425 [Candidatus Eisenbacteria bacterium]|nr:hypothetical protein [Candidatus Eisenbacteria bacterium]